MGMDRHMDEISGGERDYKHELNQAWKENDQLRSRIEKLEPKLIEAKELINAIHTADVFEFACDSRGYDCKEDADTALCKACKKFEEYIRKLRGDGNGCL